MKRVVVHIGLPKTGTTFIQYNVFPCLPNTSIVRAFHQQSGLLRIHPNHQIIITNELISGRMWFGAKSFYFNVERVKNLYNNPKIIFGIRNQNTFVTSLYKQYLHEKGYEDFDHFFNIENSGIVKHNQLLLMPKIKYLFRNFEDVFIYSQETLKERQDDFLSGLATFLELPDKTIDLGEIKNRTNVGVKSEFQVNTLRKMNKFNNRLEKIHPKLSLYTHFFTKYQLSPRFVCQDKLKKIKSPKFELNQKYLDFINKYYAKDWDAASKLVSY